MCLQCHNSLESQTEIFERQEFAATYCTVTLIHIVFIHNNSVGLYGEHHFGIAIDKGGFHRWIIIEKMEFKIRVFVVEEFVVLLTSR